MSKYLFYYTKSESARWLGHLDILRAFERALRRAGLPVAFTQGFNPRVKINFASPLSTGITGSREPAVIELTEAIAAGEVEMRLNGALPPGIQVSECVEIGESGRRDLLNSFDMAEYNFICATGADVSESDAVAAAASLLNQRDVPILREREGRSKTVNIRPFITNIQFVEVCAQTKRVTWSALVGIGESGNVRPAELASALSVYLPGLTLRRAHRARLIRNDEAENPI